VPIGWPAREYERTCNECGYSWRVPRSVARRGVRGMSAFRVGGAASEVRLGSPGGPGFAGLEAGIGARAAEMESFRICARCGVDNFAQRRVRG
jgi:hypothetical protein